MFNAIETRSLRAAKTGAEQAYECLNMDSKVQT